MTEQMEKVARTMFAVAKKHNKGYCWVSQETLEILLTKYQRWDLSERTLRRRIKDLSDQGYIKVVHRNWDEVNGVKKFRCNLYKFTKKLFLWLEKMGEYVRKVFSFFRRPRLADYSSQNPRRDLVGIPPTVEFLWKTQEKGRASPSNALG